MGKRCVLIALWLVACGPTTPPPSTPSREPSPAARPDSASAADPVLDSRGATTTDPAAPASAQPAPASSPVPEGSLRGATWFDCVKDFVDAQREPARARLIDALSVYFTTCDKIERQIAFQPPRPFPSGHNYFLESSYISFTGELSRTRSQARLRVVYHGDKWISAQRIKIAADDFRWTSPALAFRRDDDTAVWESAELPYSRALQPIVRRIVDSKEAIIRFEGRQSHGDLVVTDEMKQDLRLMMDALAAIQIP
ncbi:MAG TPA: hypothetical protein VFT22_04950 [Kofleriaceae bacterium]|nr:hypothetical protein [Kofleriaceae bacterium]